MIKLRSLLFETNDDTFHWDSGFWMNTSAKLFPVRHHEFFAREQLNIPFTLQSAQDYDSTTASKKLLNLGWKIIVYDDEENIVYIKDDNSDRKSISHNQKNELIRLCINNECKLIHEVTPGRTIELYNPPHV